MGHKSIDTTEIYAKVTDKKIDEDMKVLRELSAKRPVCLYEDDTVARPKREKKKSV